MIIKYYNNGWNYIDNVEDVKWINKTVELTEELSGQKQVQGRIYVTKGDMDAFENRIHGDVEFQLEKYNKIVVPFHHVNMQIDYDDLKRVLKQDKHAYIRLLVYRKGMDTFVLAFSHAGYLLNDNGKTVETIK